MTWSEYYKDRVRNRDYMEAFGYKYSRFIEEIVLNIKRLTIKTGTPIILKEEGCGIGTISLVISYSEDKIISTFGLACSSETEEVSKVVLSDLNASMLELCYKNTNPVFSGSYLGQVPFFYAKENICEPKFFESRTLIITHGVLEHFSDDDIKKIMSTYDNDKVLFQAHYVPTNKYESPSFGDERLLSVDTWVSLVKPDYYILDNGGTDLYMFKRNNKNG